MGLTDVQVAAYRRDGFLSPIDVFSQAEAARLYSRFCRLEEELEEEPQKRLRIKAHLPFPWLCDIVRDERLLAAVQAVIGPDILCWGASFFTKKAGDERYVSWHTDSFYYGIEPAETLTAWVSFNVSDEVSGAVRYVPGSHLSRAEHEFFPHEKNLITNGQTVPGIVEEDTVMAVLQPGQVAFHHESVVHGSAPNRSDHDRIGLSIHYVSPEARETRIEGATAMLVRGEDRHGHWGRDPEPVEDHDVTCLAALEEIHARYRAAANRKAVDGIKN